MNDSLQNDEIKALLDAANALKIPTDSLKPQNPFSPEFDTPTARTIQMWLRENRSDIAARLSGSGGHQFSLASVAAERGLIEHTAATRQELRENDEVYAKQERQASEDWEQSMLQKMQSEASTMAAQRGLDLDNIPKFNPHLTGKFANYFEALNAEERLNAQDS